MFNFFIVINLINIKYNNKYMKTEMENVPFKANMKN